MSASAPTVLPSITAVARTTMVTSAQFATTFSILKEPVALSTSALALMVTLSSLPAVPLTALKSATLAILAIILRMMSASLMNVHVLMAWLLVQLIALLMGPMNVLLVLEIIILTVHLVKRTFALVPMDLRWQIQTV
jgi:hypothetical protein